MNRGVYVLANDETYDLLCAFLASLRAVEPDIDVRVIPFDNHTKKIESLADRFGFAMFKPRDLLVSCDRISEKYHGRVMGQYRKFAIWDGPFDQFIYVDIDTVLLRPLNFTFQYLQDFDFVVSHSNLEQSRRYVWKDSAFSAKILSSDEVKYGASTGFVASKKGVIRWNRLPVLADEGLALKEHMVLMCAEQAFLNFVMVRSSSRYTSLYRLRRERPQDNIPQECWAGDDNWKVSLRGDSERGDEKIPILLIHWAGIWAHDGWEKKVYEGLKKLGLSGLPTVRRNMKHKAIWLHFRNTARLAVTRVRCAGTNAAAGSAI